MFNTEDIRGRQPLLETIEHETGRSFKKVGRWWETRCPFHAGGNERTPSFKIEDGSDWYKCWGCDPEHSTGDVITFIMHWHHLDFIEACQYLGGESEIEPDKLEQLRQLRELERRQHEDQEAQALLQRRLSFAESKLWIEFHNNLDDAARAWWRTAGVQDDWQNYWKLGVTPDLWGHGTAYTIPYRNPESLPITIQYRFAHPNGLGKYRFAPDLGSAAFITRPDLAIQNQDVIVVEGAKKAMVTHLHGTHGKLQVVGIPSENYLGGPEFDDALRQAKRLWFWPDPGASAYNWALRHIEALKPKGKVYIVRFHMKIDDALLRGLTLENFRSVLARARPLSNRSKPKR